MAERTQAEKLEELAEVDRQSRVGRTSEQASLPAAVVIIGTWAAGLAGLDLDRGAGVDMPAQVTAAWMVLATIVLAKRMNRRPAAPDERGESSVGFLYALVLILVAIALIIWISEHT